MSVTIPIMNPLRFYRPSELPDYTTYFPLIDNTTQRTQYQRGIYAQKYWYKSHLINNALLLQFRVSGLTDEKITVYEPNGDTQELTPTDISPVGWTGDTVNSYTFTPDQTGVHYMVFNEEGQTSDSFYVCSATKDIRRLLKITFRNTENDFGMVFYDSSTIKYTGTTFFEGTILPDSGYDISAFTTDRGTISKTQSTPVRRYVLTLTDVHITYKENIDHIFSCDYITVNGQEFQNAESPEITQKDRLDLIDVTISLTMSTNNYFVKSL